MKMCKMAASVNEQQQPDISAKKLRVGLLMVAIALLSSLFMVLESRTEQGVTYSLATAYYYDEKDVSRQASSATTMASVVSKQENVPSRLGGHTSSEESSSDAVASSSSSVTPTSTSLAAAAAADVVVVKRNEQPQVAAATESLRKPTSAKSATLSGAEPQTTGHSNKPVVATSPEKRAEHKGPLSAAVQQAKKEQQRSTPPPPTSKPAIAAPTIRSAESVPAAAAAAAPGSADVPNQHLKNPMAKNPRMSASVLPIPNINRAGFLQTLEWERPGKCDSGGRPSHIKPYCCFGGRIIHFRDTCQAKPAASTVDPLDRYAKAYQNQQASFFRNDNDDDTEGCNECRIADYLMRYNLTLTLQGDSVTDQSHVGIRCALLRRGYHVTEDDHKRWMRNKTYDSREGITHFAIHHLVLPKRDENDPRTYTERYSGRIVFAKAYRRPHDEHQEEVRYLLSQSDFYIMAPGLHWEPKNLHTQFANDMAMFFQQFQKHAHEASHLKLLAFRETSTQHFNLPYGYYWPGKANSPQGCVAHDKVNRTFDVIETLYRQRNVSQHGGGSLYVPLMQQAATSQQLDFVNVMEPGFLNKPRAAAHRINELVFLPFREYSTPLHYLHIHGSDCTHYCQSPQLWMAVWRGLRLAMDRAMRDYKPEEERRGGGFATSPYYWRRQRR